MIVFAYRREKARREAFTRLAERLGFAYRPEKGYATHEREILEQVLTLRSQAMATEAVGAARARVQGELARGIERLLAVAERYPDLKADRNFLELQTELALTEDPIAAARRFYNANVRELNTLCVAFPSQPPGPRLRRSTRGILRDRGRDGTRGAGGELTGTSVPLP